MCAIKLDLNTPGEKKLSNQMNWGFEVLGEKEENWDSFKECQPCNSFQVNQDVRLNFVRDSISCSPWVLFT